MKIQIVYTGRSYQTAGQLPRELTIADDATVDDALAAVAKQLGDDHQLPGSCLVAVSGEHLGTVASHTNRPLKERDELVLIAPVAGG